MVGSLCTGYLLSKVDQIAVLMQVNRTNLPTDSDILRTMCAWESYHFLTFRIDYELIAIHFPVRLLEELRRLSIHNKEL